MAFFIWHSVGCRRRWTEGLAVESRPYPVGFDGSGRNPVLGAAVVHCLCEQRFQFRTA
jgi:hypothetical protein